MCIRDRDYREYIESWVHEIKAPITASALNVENNRDERSRYLLVENRKVENYVDMALYYARMDAVYKDYMICLLYTSCDEVYEMDAGAITKVH